MNTPQEKTETRLRYTNGKFLRWFFFIGAAIPVGIVLIGSLTSLRNGVGGNTTTLKWIFLWVIWPTWILLFDAEHTATLVFMTAVSAALNGGWYMGIAFIVSDAASHLKKNRST